MTTTNPKIEAHRVWLDVYNELLMRAAGDPAVQLTDDQRAAYMTIPMVLDECQSAFDEIPPDLRPRHYLMYS